MQLFNFAVLITLRTNPLTQHTNSSTRHHVFRLSVHSLAITYKTLTIATPYSSFVRSLDQSSTQALTTPPQHLHDTLRQSSSEQSVSSTCTCALAAMASSCSVWRAMAVVCVVAVVAMAGAQACSLNDVNLCEGAVVTKAQPSKPCCDQVANVDAGCFCNLVASGNYPQDYVTNAVNIPSACGGAAHDKFKGQNCAGRVVP